jgi:hypothetical protein
MTVARFQLAPVRETMFPSRAPFFKDRLNPRAAEIAACAERDIACDVAQEAVPALPARPSLAEGGNLTVSPDAPSLAHRPKVGL